MTIRLLHDKRVNTVESAHIWNKVTCLEVLKSRFCIPLLLCELIRLLDTSGLVLFSRMAKWVVGRFLNKIPLGICKNRGRPQMILMVKAQAQGWVGEHETRRWERLGVKGMARANHRREVRLGQRR